MDQKVVLEVQDLEIVFRNKEDEIKVVNKVNLEINKGEVCGLIGESGCGKTIFARSILKLLPRNAFVKNGSIKFKEHDILNISEKNMTPLRGDRIAMIFQDPQSSLDPVFTIGYQIEEVLILHTDLSRRDRKNRVLELLSMVGIDQPEKRVKQYPHELSGGMKQRILIAMAIACSPELLIADEITTSLDVTTQAEIVRLLIDLKEKLGMAILFITHDLSVASEICDCIFVMLNGSIVEGGSREQILFCAKHEYTKKLIDCIGRIDIEF